MNKYAVINTLLGVILGAVVVYAVIESIRINTDSVVEEVEITEYAEAERQEWLRNYVSGYFTPMASFTPSDIEDKHNENTNSQRTRN